MEKQGRRYRRAWITRTLDVRSAADTTDRPRRTGEACQSFAYLCSSDLWCVQFTVVLHKPFGIAFRTDDLHRCVVSKTRDCQAELKEGDRLVAVNNNPVCGF